MDSAGRSRHAYGEYNHLDTALASVLDDLPLWSAPFGLRLLERVVLRPGITAIDIGGGTGFPSLELADRLGSTSVVHAIEPWAEGAARIRHKLAIRGTTNVLVHECAGEQLPLADRSVDLIVSNNGLNNVQDLDRVLAECARVARPGAQMVLTWNLPETMREFYDVLSDVLGSALADRAEADRRVGEHVFHKRKSLSFMRERVQAAGFATAGVVEDQFSLRFLDGAAMFDHFLMRSGFVGPWLELVEEPARQSVFQEIEARLNDTAGRQGGLALTVPFACLDCHRH